MEKSSEIKHLMSERNCAKCGCYYVNGKCRFPNEHIIHIQKEKSEASCKFMRKISQGSFFRSFQHTEVQNNVIYGGKRHYCDAISHSSFFP